MRIALLVTDLQLGGAPLRLASTARLLRARGVDVHVGCLADPGPVSRLLLEAGIPTFACGATGPTDFFALFRLYKHLRTIRPALLHTTLVHANLAGRLVGRILGLPVITSTATIERRQAWHVSAERFTQRLSNAHLVNSASLADEVQRRFGVPKRRVHVVPPFLDRVELPDRNKSRLRHGIAEHEFVVAWLGRLDAVKRVDLVIRCAEILSDPPCRFLIAGDGPQRDVVERAIRTSSAARRVNLLGWVAKPYDVLCAADAFLFPSQTEGQPNALMQAMRAGLPIVASDIPAHRELAGLPPAPTGPPKHRSIAANTAPAAVRMILVSGDEPFEYARILSQLIEDARLRASLGRQAMEYALRAFDPDAAIDALLAVYREYALLRRAN